MARSREKQKESSGADASADRARALEIVPAAPKVVERLDRFAVLVRQWQSRINLIGDSTLAQLWTRHIADSLQLLALAPAAKIWIDLGSGAGFPGLVIACALAGQTGVRVHLVESNAKKAAFLREAVRQLGVPAEVHAERAETFIAAFQGRADVVTARALAPLAELLEMAAPLFKTGAKGLFPKGQDVEVELTQAAKCWTIESTLVPSRTSPSGRIVVIQSAERHGRR
jgi:16S rRNA (guanine527-N7)-methyltransferase